MDQKNTKYIVNCDICTYNNMILELPYRVFISTQYNCIIFV